MNLFAERPQRCLDRIVRPAGQRSQRRDRALDHAPSSFRRRGEALPEQVFAQVAQDIGKEELAVGSDLRQELHAFADERRHARDHSAIDWACDRRR